MLLQFLFFLAVVFSIFFGAHWYLYRSLLEFYSITDPALQTAMFIMFTILSVSFIIASIAANYLDNYWIKKFYYATGFWMGLMVYIFLALSLVWLTIGIFNLFGWPFPTVAVVSFLLALTLSAGVYAAMTGKDLVVKNIEVKIKNLPGSWDGKTAIQLSDIHLGVLSGPEFMDEIIKKVDKIAPDIIFITGDYYDGTCPCLEKLTEPLKRLDAPLGVFMINGNHEAYTGTEKIAELLKETNVYYLRDDIVEVNGVTIIGTEYPPYGIPRFINVLLKKVDKNKPTILLHHEPRNIRAARLAGVNLQLSGHAHLGQLWPANLITRMIYGKYHYGLHTKNDYNIYTSSGTGVWGPPMRLGSNSEIVVIKMLKK